MSDYQANIIIKNPATPTGPVATGRAPGMWKLSEVAYWIKQGVWPNASIVPDPYFPYVSLLLSTTALGNANNNLFVDSSSASTPISRGGNATQGSFTPYGSNWSNYFDGSGDYLSVPSSSSLNFGTGDWTVECWVYISTRTTSYPLIFGNNRGAWTTDALALTASNADSASYNDKFVFAWNNGGFSSPSAGTSQLLVANVTNSLGTWYHFAVVRNGTSIRMYRNGAEVASATVSAAATFSWGFNGSLIGGGNWDGAGGYMNGYVSNLRVTSSAVYTSAFTPSTTPLTAITGTVYLTCQSNRFRDNSSTALTVTANGDAKVSDFGPFSPAYPGISYNQSDIQYWSGYFDGSGDYLTVPSNTAFAYGTGDFTVEGWLYKAASGTTVVMDYASSGGFGFQITDTQIYAYQSVGASFIFTYTVPLNAWIHIALVRTGGNLYCYANGALVGSLACTTSFTSPSDLNIGRNAGANSFFWNGYISNLRIVKGTAVYTGAFTPSTTPLTAISGTSLLTCQNAAFTDNSTNNFPITIFGNSTVTGNAPFNPVGFWSVQFNGSSNWLAASANTATTLGTGNFTIEGWFYTTYSGANQILIEQAVIDEGSGNNQGWLLYVGTSGNLIFGSAGGATYINASPATSFLGKWTHFALVRTSTTSITLYVNGTSIGSTTTNVNMNMALDVRADTPTVMGSHELQLAGSFFNGYLSNFRIVKGTAVYTANFTPPTEPLTAISGTGLLTLQSSRFVDNSGNNITVAPSFSSYSGGSPQVQPFDPFYTSTIASNGGSMYFDGSGDYLQAPRSPLVVPTTNDFTFECWMYPTTNSSGQHIMGCVESGITGDWGMFRHTDNTLGLYVGSTGADTYGGTSIIRTNQWNHVALSRVSGTLYKCVNGAIVSVSFTSSLNNNTSYPLTIAADNGGDESFYTGWMAGIRIINGTGIYSGSSYSVPTTPYGPASNATTLLINGMNAGIYDATAINDLETFGNTQVTTVQSKFGTSSIYFDGADDVLVAPSSSDLDFGTGDFTIEMWVRPSNFSGSGGANGLICRRRTDTIGTGAWAIYLNSSGNVLFQDVQNASIIFTSSSPLTINTWQHLAVTRSGSTIRCFIDGVLVGSGTSSLSYSNTWYLIMGMYGTSGGSWPSGSRGSFYTGYMDDVRITRGIARYTANFTPPTMAFPTY